MTSTAVLKECGPADQRQGRWLAPLGLFLLGFCLIPLAHTCWTRCVPGDIGDARFNNIILEYFYRWASGQEPSLISPGFFYPMPGALSFSDNHWGSAWIYSIFRALGADRYLAFSLWYLVAYVLNFFACHLLLRKMRFSPIASALGAFVFAFAMPVSVKHWHAQLMYRWLAPMALLLWQCFRDRGNWMWLGAMALAIAAQFYFSIYLGYFTLLMLAAWVASQMLIERSWPWQLLPARVSGARSGELRELAAALLMIACALAAMAWLMYPYLHYSRIYQFHRDASEIGSMLPRLRSYLLADNSTIWAGMSQALVPDMPMRHEQQLFLGLGIALLSLLGVVLPGARIRWVAASTILLLVALTLSIAGHSLYDAIATLPGVNSIRAVTRIVLILLIPVSVLVAAGVDGLRRRGATAGMAASLLALVVITEAASVKTVHFDRKAAEARVQHLKDGLPRALPADALLFVAGSPQVPSFVTELDGMALAQDLKRNTLNGYSGNAAPGYGGDSEAAPCQQAMNRLRAAALFFEGELHQPLPSDAHAKVFVPGHPECARARWEPVPLDAVRGVSLQILSVKPLPSGWQVAVRLANATSYALPASATAQPLRLSWQVHPRGTPTDPAKWSPRVDIGAVAGDFQSGEARELTFDIPRLGTDEVVSVSAVLEGRAWLHDLGVPPVTVPLG